MALAHGASVRATTVAPLPGPRVPAGELSTARALWTMRRDVLEVWPRHYYRELRLRRRLFGRDYFLFNDPAEIDELLIAHAEHYQRDPTARRLLQPVVGRGLLLAEGEEWRRQRRALAPAFQPRHVDRLIPSFHAEAGRAFERWSGERRQRRHLLRDFRAITLAIAGRAMFGIDDPAQLAELEALMDGYERSTARLGWRDYLALLGWAGLEQSAARDAFRCRWHGWAAAFDRRRAPIGDLDAAGDLLDLLRAVRDPTGAPLSQEETVDQIGTMMAAGFVTTSVALFWSAVLLAVHPEVQAAIRQEADDAASPPAAAELRAAPATQAFLYEALRLYPPVYAFTRWAVSDDRIGGTEVRRGSGITVAPWVLHRHAAHWAAPERFDPGRFLRDGRVVPPKAWMPFGAGLRTCIGMAFALTEIAVALRLLVQRFDVALAGPCPRPVGRFTLMPDVEPVFELTRR